MVYKNIKIY